MMKRATETSRKRKGRPPLRPHKKKTEIVRIRVTKDELKALKKAAKEAGTNIPQVLMKPWRKEN